MQVEQKNIWEDVTRNAKRDNSNRAIAAYQANMPDAGAVVAFGGQEAYVQQKTAVSEAGNIDTVYVIFMIIGIVGYFTIPTVASWIVSAGGTSAYNRNVARAGSIAGAAVGAASGKVTGKLLK